MLSINDYQIINDLRCDRSDTDLGRGGGLIVYVKNSVKVTPIKCDIVFNQYIVFKLCSVKRQSNDDLTAGVSLYSDSRENLTVILFYRSPNSSEENTNNLIELFNRFNNNVLILGDLNLPKIDWESGSSDLKGRKVLECVDSNGLYQLVNFPTHTAGNILDVVITDDHNLVHNVRAGGNIGNSDHTSLIIDLFLDHTPQGGDIRTRDWQNGDTDGLYHYLDSTDWDMQLGNCTGTEVWSKLDNIVKYGLDTYVPFTLRKRTSRPHWLNKNCKRAINAKQRLFKNYLKNKTHANFEMYKKAEKHCNNTVRNAKKRFERKLASNNNKKGFSSYVKSRTKAKEAIGPLNINGSLVHDEELICQELNNFFGSVFTRENTDSLPNFDDVSGGNSIDDLLITPDMIKKEISLLKPSMSSGPGEYTNRFLKEYGVVLAKPLSILFNKVLGEGIAPENWKLAYVTPIFKKGSKGEPGNYRPVSLTCVVGKLFERLIKRAICEHLETNNLLSPDQHGFRPGRSCTTNLLESLERILTSIDAGCPYDVIYYDFSKAFDKVPKERLLLKLEAYGIKGNLLKWLKDWLSGRKQATVINGHISEWLDVLSGVPQGSVLGPILFIIFINDIYKCATGIDCLKVFADDTKSGNRVDTSEGHRALQECINRLLKWANDWQMSFNAKKCKVLHFGHNNVMHSYDMEGVPLAADIVETDIGVDICTSLKPSKHCQRAARTAHQVLGQVTRSFHYRDKYVLPKIYKCYVRPHLEFACPVWAPWLTQDIDLLENVQKRFVRMVSGLTGITYEEKLQELGMMSLKDRRKYFDLIETFKCIRGLTNVDYKQWFTLIGDDNRRPTRGAYYPLNISPQRCRLDVRQNFFPNRVANAWNSLPHDMRQNLSLSAFKTNLKSHILESGSSDE